MHPQRVTLPTVAQVRERLKSGSSACSSTAAQVLATPPAESQLDWREVVARARALQTQTPTAHDMLTDTYG
jgi:hypothetical protein